MSESDDSDDTDVLLSIRPDFYTVASSSLNQSTESLTSYKFKIEDNKLVSNLIEHVQLLEDRINIIESKENSLDFINLSLDRSCQDQFKQLNLISDKLSNQRIDVNELLMSNLKFYSSKQSSNNNKCLTDDDYYSAIKNNDLLINNDCKLDLNEKDSIVDELKITKQNKFDNEKRSIGITNSTPIKKSSSFNCSFNFTNGNNTEINILDDQNDSKLIKSSIQMSSENNKKEEIRPINSELELWESQKLVSLSDFWFPGSHKSDEEMLKIKLGEEQIRRKHCEKVIQDLQKRLLEEEEKIGVAIKVDKEKNEVISQYQIRWSKFKERWNILEAENNNLKVKIDEINTKNENNLSENNLKIKELSDENEQLKVKCDQLMKEKLNLLSNNANEIEKYKLLIQTSENRYDNLKIDYDELLNKNQQLDQNMKIVKQELQKEGVKNNEVRNELSVIHKALETCEAELTVLRQEKENLQLKLKEEGGRIDILERNKEELVNELEKTKKSEKLIKDEIQSLILQHENQRTELRNIYQSQVDDAVNIKLKEFQSQLDAAETNFQTELENKQRIIAECAAKKIKKIIDKHELEVNLLEEKHKEEKRLYDIRLSQIMKKAAAFEAQLDAQQNAKSHLAEQLHSLMEKQYQQALKIITKDSYILQSDNLRKDFTDENHLEKLGMEMKTLKRRNSEYPEVDQDNNESFNISNDKTTINKTHDSTTNDLKKYIKMILQMQQQNSVLDSTVDTNSQQIFREVPRKNYMKVDGKNGVNGVDSQAISLDSANKYTMPLQFKPPWK